VGEGRGGKAEKSGEKWKKTKTCQRIAICNFMAALLETEAIEHWKKAGLFRNNITSIIIFNFCNFYNLLKSKIYI